jgi:hypothetical protein
MGQTTRDEESQRGNGDMEAVLSRGTILAGLAANVLFFWGSLCFLFFSLFELKRKSRTNEARYAYISAFVSNFLSGVVEFAIDSCSSSGGCLSSAVAAPSTAAATSTAAAPQKFRHGRYSTNARWNQFISFLFMAGTILDVVAFFLWDNLHFVQEHRMLLVGSHTWLLSAIAVLWAKTPKLVMHDMRKLVERIDDLGNVLFFLGVVVDCMVRYLDEPTAPAATESVHFLEFVSAPLWLCGAGCYVLADLYRLLVS